jgi:hypothetical protein
MGFTLEEEAKRFVESKRIQFISGLTDAASDLTNYIQDNLHHSDDRDHALKALQETVLWCRSCLEKHGIK